MSTKRIIAVDDDRAVLELLKTAVENIKSEKHSYSLEVCEDENGLKIALAKSHPDLIILDASMPGVDGISLCRHLKHSSSTAEVPIIILTAYDDKQTQHDAFLFGADAFVSKPFDVKELLKKIEVLVEGESET